MAKIEVDTGLAVSVGAQGVPLSAQVAELRGRLDTVSASSGAAGASELAGVIEGCCGGWSSALSDLAALVAQLGANLEAAGGAYEATDASVMPQARR